MGGGNPVQLFLGSDANNGNVSWNYDAKIAIVSMIGVTYNHIMIINLQSLNATTPTTLSGIWMLRNNYNNNDWIYMTTGVPLVGTGTSKSLNVAITESGYKINMVIPLDVDFPTNITP